MDKDDPKKSTLFISMAGNNGTWTEISAEPTFIDIQAEHKQPSYHYGSDFYNTATFTPSKVSYTISFEGPIQWKTIDPKKDKGIKMHVKDLKESDVGCKLTYTDKSTNEEKSAKIKYITGPTKRGFHINVMITNDGPTHTEHLYFSDDDTIYVLPIT